MSGMSVAYKREFIFMQSIFLLHPKVSFTWLRFSLQNIEWRAVNLLRSRCQWSSRFKVTKETESWHDVYKRLWQLQTNIQTSVQSSHKPILRLQEPCNLGRDFRTVSPGQIDGWCCR